MAYREPALVDKNVAIILLLGLYICYIVSPYAALPVLAVLDHIKRSE